jgi:PAS domain S-box-containing protein
LLALSIIALLASTGVSQAPASSPKRVLLLFNNDSFSTNQVTIDRALRSTLKAGSISPIETYSEYVGNTRAGTGYEAEFIALMRKKYEGKKFDLIFAIGQFPLSMLLRNRADLFPDTPIVSLAIDKRIVEDYYPAPGLTGVWGEVDFKRNLALALTLHPATKHVVVVQGVAESDQEWANRAESDFRECGSGLEFSDLIGLTVPEMRNALAALAPETIVIFVSSIRDRSGNIYESTDYLARVADASTAPIFGTTEGQLGNGIVGGTLLSFEELGNEGGRMGLRVMGGEDPNEIAPHIVPSVAIFDWRQLQRWRVNDSLLPQGSVIRFKDPTFWDEYRGYALALFGAITIETLLIGWLVMVRIRRRQAETEKMEVSSRLKDIVSNVPGIVWESRNDPATKQRKTTFISDYVEKMCGYSPEEWLARQPGFGITLIPEEDRERVARESEEVIKTGKDGISEYRWRTKDGGIRWVENYISPIFDSARKVVGLRGVTLDVTNRKLAEENERQAEEKDRAILAAVPDLMFLQSPDGVYLDYQVNDTNDLLVPPEAFMGKNMRDVLPPDLAEQFAKCFALVRPGGEPQVLEYHLGIDDKDKWYEARMVRTADNILSVVRDITDRKRAEQERRELSGRLLNALEDERARLARELHDGVCQDLALLAIELSMFEQRLPKDEAIMKEMEELSDRVSGLSSDLRRISQELHPAILTRLGLVNAIRSFCREVDTAHELKVRFEEHEIPPLLPDTLSLSIYRMVQESLQNTIKHSGATNANVSLKAYDHTLKLEVTDNGCGFDPAAVRGKGTLGLVSMRERARLINGKITIDSHPGKGTRIEATMSI